MSNYQIQGLQTSPTTMTVLLARNAKPAAFWPRLTVKANLANGNSVYRVGQVALYTPNIVTVDSAETVDRNIIADLTVKAPSSATDAAIEAHFDELVKLLQDTSVRASLVEQVRLSVDIATA